MERRVSVDESAWPLRRPKLVDDKEHPFVGLTVTLGSYTLLIEYANSRPQQAELPDPRHIPFRRGQDHPVIFIGWLKHAHFDVKYTFDLSWPFQLTRKAFRSDDWWQLVSPHNLLEADLSTVAGRVMQSQDWGHATSIPPKVDHDVCSVPLREGQIAMNSSDTVDEARKFASSVMST
ncbi:MAG: hypothetical protein Q9177_002596, partial [Variospora cf. flavescens]